MKAFHQHQPKTFEDLQKIPGWGKGLLGKAKEWIETGHIEADRLLNSNNDATELFMGISGIGPVKARELAEAGYRTIEELKEHPELLNTKQIIGLKYYNDFLKRIPRKEMDVHKTKIEHVIQSISKDIIFELVGSYRRGQNSSGDIDVLIQAHENLRMEEVVSLLSKDGYITDILAQGEKKFMGVCRLKRHSTHRRLDILITTNTNYPFALLYFTGSGEFNIKMRQWALNKGYSLNEYGLTPTIDGIRTEEDIFKALELKYVEPHNRTPDIDLE